MSGFVYPPSFASLGELTLLPMAIDYAALFLALRFYTFWRGALTDTIGDSFAGCLLHVLFHGLCWLWIVACVERTCFIDSMCCIFAGLCAVQTCVVGTLAGDLFVLLYVRFVEWS